DKRLPKQSSSSTRKDIVDTTTNSGNSGQHDEEEDRICVVAEVTITCFGQHHLRFRSPRGALLQTCPAAADSSRIGLCESACPAAADSSRIELCESGLNSSRFTSFCFVFVTNRN
ncbi:hypothetical protein Tco_1036244, partial [Tanacetum coccineum]